ncbi:hypothetical protein GGI20_000071 [Coemansia sp. BCRC 34301]|nr:hypothetical protein GGI20_000071 [Coemansia sp. BCRC 34301]
MSNNEQQQQQQKEEPITISVAKYRSGEGYARLGQPGIVGPTLSSALVITGTPTDGARVVRHEYNENGESSVEKGELSIKALAIVFAAVNKLKSLPKRNTPGGSDIYGANTLVEVRQGRNIIWGHTPGGGCCVQDDEDEDNEVAALGIDDGHKASFASVVKDLCDATASISADKEKKEH